MSHPQQIQFVSSVRASFPKYFTAGKVLEIGSLNINGSVRQFFDNCDYIGIDVGAGRDVDIVCEGHKYEADAETFDTVISCECFEHNPHWAETFHNMINLCKTGGLVIMTCATTGRPEHGTTRTSPADSPLTVGKGWEYYKNLTEEDFNNIINASEVFTSHNYSVNPQSHDLYFWGIKK